MMPLNMSKQCSKKSNKGMKVITNVLFLSLGSKFA